MPVDFHEGVDVALIPTRSLCCKGLRNRSPIAIVPVAGSEQSSLSSREWQQEKSQKNQSDRGSFHSSGPPAPSSAAARIKATTLPCKSETAARLGEDANLHGLSIPFHQFYRGGTWELLARQVGAAKMAE